MYISDPINSNSIDIASIFSTEINTLGESLFTTSLRQSEAYRQKTEEADLILTNPNLTLDEIKNIAPIIFAEAEARGINPITLASMIKDKSDSLRRINAILEGIRSATKLRIQAAASNEEKFLLREEGLRQAKEAIANVASSF